MFVGNDYFTNIPVYLTTVNCMIYVPVKQNDQLPKHYKHDPPCWRKTNWSWSWWGLLKGILYTGCKSFWKWSRILEYVKKQINKRMFCIKWVYKIYIYKKLKILSQNTFIKTVTLPFINDYIDYYDLGYHILLVKHVI